MTEQSDQAPGAAPQSGPARISDPTTPPHESVVDDLGGPPSHSPSPPPGNRVSSVEDESLRRSAADYQAHVTRSLDEPQPLTADARELFDAIRANSMGGNLPHEGEPSELTATEPVPTPADLVEPDPGTRRRMVLAAMAAVGLTGAAILAIALNQGGGQSSPARSSAVVTSSAAGTPVGAPAVASPVAAAADASGPLRTSGAFTGPLTPQGPVHCFQGELNHAQFTASDGTPMFVSTSTRVVDILTSGGEFRGTGAVTHTGMAIAIGDVVLSGQGKTFHLIGTVTCGQ